MQKTDAGRSERADVSLPHDPKISKEHLLIAWDGERCRVEDLGSHSGTFVDGLRVEQAELANGAWLRLGDTDLMVYLEQATPPGAADWPDPMDLVRQS